MVARGWLAWYCVFFLPFLLVVAYLLGVAWCCLLLACLMLLGLLFTCSGLLGLLLACLVYLVLLGCGWITGADRCRRAARWLACGWLVAPDSQVLVVAMGFVYPSQLCVISRAPFVV
jgi:hypothetical protein